MFLSFATLTTVARDEQISVCVGRIISRYGHLHEENKSQPVLSTPQPSAITGSYAQTLHSQ